MSGASLRTPQPAEARPHPRRLPRPTRIAAAARPVPVAQSRRVAPRILAAMVAAGQLQAEGKTPAAAACDPGRGTWARKGSWALRAGAGPAGLRYAPRTRRPPPLSMRGIKAQAQNCSARAVHKTFAF